jgi:hypothetical protein
MKAHNSIDRPVPMKLFSTINKLYIFVEWIRVDAFIDFGFYLICFNNYMRKYREWQSNYVIIDFGLKGWHYSFLW